MTIEMWIGSLVADNTMGWKVHIRSGAMSSGMSSVRSPVVLRRKVPEKADDWRVAGYLCPLISVIPQCRDDC
jgi:hypothetical protein